MKLREGMAKVTGWGGTLVHKTGKTEITFDERALKFHIKYGSKSSVRADLNKDAWEWHPPLPKGKMNNSSIEKEEYLLQKQEEIGIGKLKKNEKGIYKVLYLSESGEDVYIRYQNEGSLTLLSINQVRNDEKVSV